MKPLGRHAPIIYILLLPLAVALVVAALVTYARTLDPEAGGGHALRHVLMGSVGLALVMWVTRRWAPSTRCARVTRVITAVALLMFTAGQFGEAIGAFGWVGVEEKHPALGILHDVSVRATWLGVFVALICIPWLATALVAERFAERATPIVIAVNVGADLLIAFVFLFLLLVRALGDNWWLAEGQVVAASCDSQIKSSTIVERDIQWLETRTPIGTDTSLIPVPGAQVEMFVRLDGRSPFRKPAWVDASATDEDGWFRDESGGPADRFGLRITAPGYQRAEGVFRIKDIASTPQAFEVTLRPEGC